jgi:hypothetical protein
MFLKKWTTALATLGLVGLGFAVKAEHKHEGILLTNTTAMVDGIEQPLSAEERDATSYLRITFQRNPSGYGSFTWVSVENSSKDKKITGTIKAVEAIPPPNATVATRTVTLEPGQATTIFTFRGLGPINAWVAGARFEP